VYVLAGSCSLLVRHGWRITLRRKRELSWSRYNTSQNQGNNFQQKSMSRKKIKNHCSWHKSGPPAICIKYVLQRPCRMRASVSFSP